MKILEVIYYSGYRDEEYFREIEYVLKNHLQYIGEDFIKYFLENR